MTKLLPAAMAVVLLAGIATSLAACSSEKNALPTSREGPVSFLADDDFTQAATMLADKGQRVVFGALSVINEGDHSATLDRAMLTGPRSEVSDEGAKVSEVRVLDVTGGQDLVGAGPWPYEYYERDSVPLSGYAIAPDAQAELLFVVDVEESGNWSWPQTQLTYRSQGETYTIRANTGFLICPTTAGHCALSG
ncbi:hypothetical protein [Nocardioides sp. L-11A]|uniref:hypothetical protein n=1 Tax=Nocardioides sp. L-11A TaxID=3043848 RepID=UPI00249CC82C|nr:hypothetical protein QJ852_20105 [Nocardioides sp. L-11A]